jgi:hypothetical protein
MVLDRTEIEQLAKDCGLYIVEGRGTIGLALEHPLLKDWKDHMYAVREDIVVKFKKESKGYVYTAMRGMAELRHNYAPADSVWRYKEIGSIFSDCGGIDYSLMRNEFLMPELIVKAVADNLRTRLDDLMKGGLLSRKKKHMNDIKTCGGEYELV